MMLRFAFVTLLTLSTLGVTTAAFACPSGYVSCGESGQLCCPG